MLKDFLRDRDRSKPCGKRGPGLIAQRALGLTGRLDLVFGSCDTARVLAGANRKHPQWPADAARRTERVLNCAGEWRTSNSGAT
jgi:hypothetical protein